MNTVTDAVVIGGGLMGTSILYNLVSRGVETPVLLERSTLGSGSTGRSSGVVHLFTDPELPRAKLTQISLKIYRNFEETLGIADPGFVNTGFLIMNPYSDEAKVKEHVGKQQRLGVSTSIISVEEAQILAPDFALREDEIFIWEPDAGYGDPSGVALAYSKGARELGATVVLGTEVTDIVIKNNRVTAVVTDTETYDTESAIVATGPWSGEFLNKLGLNLPLKPTLAEVFVLRVQNTQNARGPGGSDRSNNIYFRPEGKDMILVGGNETPGEINPDVYPQEPAQETVIRNWKALSRRVPFMEHAEFFKGYTGVYTTTPDRMPIIDKVNGIDGLYICTGFSGRGFKLAPAVGMVVSEMMIDGNAKSADISSMRMDRF